MAAKKIVIPEGYVSSTEVVMDNPTMTYRQFDYWCRIGLIQHIFMDNHGELRKDPGSGNVRLITDDEHEIIKLALRLKGFGFEIASGMEYARRAMYFFEQSKDDPVVVSSVISVHLADDIKLQFVKEK